MLMADLVEPLTSFTSSSSFQSPCVGMVYGTGTISFIFDFKNSTVPSVYLHNINIGW